MDKVRIGVLGAYRGGTMIEYCEKASNAQLVAVCDKYPGALKKIKEEINDDSVTYYSDFEDFIKHDMDAVVLANYATEHAPFAIRCMERGLHVFSEVLPCQTMKEAVELIECVERTGKIYAYGENYCYMGAPREMRKLYREGKIGEFEYGEGEYVHNCAPIWPDITYGEPDHWRNRLYSTYYVTHSLGPLIHITGLRPVSVIGVESTMNDRPLGVGRRGAGLGMEIVTLEGGAIVKSIHGELYENSIWYTVYGSKGRMESAREDAIAGDVDRIYLKCDEYPGEYADRPATNWEPKDDNSAAAEAFGHGGSDFYSMFFFVEKILGRDYGEVIDVYEALDMFLPGLFAYRSILNGSVPVEVPDLRDPAEREKWRNDVACTDPAVAGDALLPTAKGGTPDVPDEVYERVRKEWESRG
ncbi:MAG: Gfo/Idh/MocA family oxidoreductase [Clostridia bacterium]|nr:Gfo/Idh/MocA family oxidoreductase [Clostridia bacterium]